MKLRVHANSVRLRLNREEVSHFASAGRIEDFIDFGNGQKFRYALEAGEGREARALWEAGTLRVVVPQAEARDWTGTERVGIEGTPAIGPNVLVEKDFQCLHRDAEPGAYPNPALSAEE